MKITLSILLALLLVLSAFPISAFAADIDNAQTSADEALADIGATTITTANVTVTAPYAGKNPDFSPIAGNSTFSIATVKWSAWETSTPIVMSESNIFRSTFNYTLTMEIVPGSGYQFAASGSSSAMTVKINGSEASIYTVSGYSAANRIKVVKTFGPVADTGIKSVQASIAKPLPDETPSYSAWIPLDSAGYEVEDYDGVYYKDGVCWFDDTAGSSIKCSEPAKFINGHQYTVTVSLVPKKGYTFYKTTSSITGKLNGNTAEVGNFNTPEKADLNISLKYQFTCEKEKINTIAVNVTPPVSGQTPSFTASTDSSGYDVYKTLNTSTFKNSVEWYDLTAGSTVATNGSVKFIDGHKYRVTVLVKANNNYEFPNTGVTGTVNGKTGSVFAMHNYDKTQFRTVECEFTATKAVTSVTVTGVTAPKNGEKPSYYATIPAGVKYDIEADYSNDTWKNGVIWRNETDGKYMSSTDTFVTGKQYKVTVSLVNIDYPFSADVTGTLNGKTANIIKYGDGTSNIGVSYTFTCWAPTQISFFEASINIPAAGEPLSYNATVPLGKGYMIEDYNSNAYKYGVSWLDADSGDFYTAADNPKAVAGKRYTVHISLVPVSEKYEFCAVNDASGKINGVDATVGRYTKTNYYLSYTFTVGSSGSYTVSGNFTSYLDSAGEVRIYLVKNGSVMYASVANGNTGTYSITDVVSGTYSMRVEKDNHVTREYPITVSGNITQNVKIHPKGDINGDGKVTSRDFGMAYAHAQKLKDSTLTGYALDCADVVKKDGKVTTTDAARINAHIQKTDPLW